MKLLAQNDKVEKEQGKGVKKDRGSAPDKGQGHEGHGQVADTEDVVAELTLGDDYGVHVMPLKGSYLSSKERSPLVTVVIDTPMINSGPEIRQDVPHKQP
eukprot:CAMPEP_0184673614 /NCGR_PEP_ID=MMETSP0308-20130426/86777_1 /TAXON_ID=38269 /ORGANISM="Gloeochaete witrockiana, Strain SAG 46.84" /LENGTH=99 /DNA_ID=CAMNT_0027121119 /DNA_START=611 /DNA_END=910 /DNA_ORIENTATION=+